MRVLGAVLAGGRSRRFGSDKALATVGGIALIDRIVAALALQVEAVVIVGRGDARRTAIPDYPVPALGPLGGLAAALRHGAAHGFDAVLSVPCDVPDLPCDLAARLGRESGAAYAASLPVIGWWPIALAPKLTAFVASDSRRSMRGWAAEVGAVAVELPPLANINTPADLARL